jgi:hypothetical protein
MSVRVELWLDGVIVDGVEEWWDSVEATLENDPDDYALLESISPYGQVRIPHERLVDLAEECRRLLGSAQGPARFLLLRIADLCERGSAAPDAELRFEGD